MIEFLGIAYVVSLLLSLLVMFWSFAMTRRRLHSPRLAQINANLRTVELYWLSSQDDFAVLSEGSVEADAQKSLRSVGIMGFLCFLGPIGLLLLLIINISMAYLVKSRKQVAVFHSALATQENLDAEQVKKLVQELGRIS